MFFFTAGTLTWAYVRLRRQRKDIKDLLHFITNEQSRIDTAARLLVEVLSDIANASARSGESEYMLAKRLNLILTSPRGEGRTIRDYFLILANFYDGGLLSYLEKTYHLTHGDLILCGMITLGMDPTCISKIRRYDHERTFYNKRSDLRRKLHLEHNIPLESFLNELVRMLQKDRQAYLKRLADRY